MVPGRAKAARGDSWRRWCKTTWKPRLKRFLAWRSQRRQRRRAQAADDRQGKSGGSPCHQYSLAAALSLCVFLMRSMSGSDRRAHSLCAGTPRHIAAQCTAQALRPHGHQRRRAGAHACACVFVRARTCTHARIRTRARTCAGAAVQEARPALGSRADWQAAGQARQGGRQSRQAGRRQGGQGGLVRPRVDGHLLRHRERVHGLPGRPAAEVPRIPPPLQ